MNPAENYFEELTFRYPPYYAVIIQDIATRYNLAIRIDSSNKVNFPNSVVMIQPSHECVILVPDLTPVADPNVSEIVRKSRLLSACLVLGHELAHLALHYTATPKQGGSKILEHLNISESAEKEHEAVDFSVRAALRAGLFAFDSNVLCKYLGKISPALLEEYQTKVFSSPILPFSIGDPAVSTFQLYEILRHANRMSTLLSLIFSCHNPEIARLLKSLEARMSTYAFELDHVHVASPGSFLLALKKGYDKVKKFLPRVRKTLKTIPFLDLHIEEVETRYIAQIEENKADAEEAIARRTNARINRKMLELLEERLEIGESLEQLGLSGSRITEKLLKSAQVLGKHDVKPSD